MVDTYILRVKVKEDKLRFDEEAITYLLSIERSFYV